MEKAMITNWAIQGGASMVVSKYLVGLSWKKAALLGLASIITPLIVNRVRTAIAQQQAPEPLTAPTGVLQ